MTIHALPLHRCTCPTDAEILRADHQGVALLACEQHHPGMVAQPRTAEATR